MPFGNLLGHIVCREGVLFDPTKVFVILNIHPPTIAKQLQTTLGHTTYYRIFIRSYVSTNSLLENLLKKYEFFSWKPKCDQAFNILKEKLSSPPIMIYPDWKVGFHVHIDASCIALGVILAQLVNEICIIPSILRVESFLRANKATLPLKEKVWPLYMLFKNLENIC